MAVHLLPYAVLFTWASRSLIHDCRRSEGREMAKSLQKRVQWQQIIISFVPLICILYLVLTGILQDKITCNTINIKWAWSADKYSLTVSMQSSSVLVLCSVRTRWWAHLCGNQHHVSDGSCGDKIKSCFIHSPLKKPPCSAANKTRVTNSNSPRTHMKCINKQSHFGSGSRDIVYILSAAARIVGISKNIWQLVAGKTACVRILTS